MRPFNALTPNENFSPLPSQKQPPLTNVNTTSSVQITALVLIKEMFSPQPTARKMNNMGSYSAPNFRTPKKYPVSSTAKGGPAASASSVSYRWNLMAYGINGLVVDKLPRARSHAGIRHRMEHRFQGDYLDRTCATNLSAIETT